MTLSEDDIRKYAESAQKATAIINDFLEKEIVPVLLSQINPSDFEEIITGLYCRLVLFARTLSALSDPQHFQTVRTTARTAFELFLDIHQLAATPALAEKINAFTKVTKYDSARKLVMVAKKYPHLDLKRYRHQIAFIADAARTAEFEELVDRFWKQPNGKKNIPQHWSGLSIAERARNTGPEYDLMYYYDYVVNCTVSHSGIIFVQDMSHAFFVNAFGLGHIHFQKLILRATSIVCDALHIHDAKPNLRGKLDGMEMLSARIAAESIYPLDMSFAGDPTRVEL